jgi:hypothetical protein
MDVDVEHPHHHHRTGHRWLDAIVSSAALFVSLISILIAWHHGETMRELVHQNERLVQANSLPHLLLFGSNAKEDGTLEPALGVKNQGVGPAEIRSVEVLVDGKPVENLRQLLQACCGKHDYSGVSTSTLLATMLRPGDTTYYVRMPVTEANRAGATAFDKARMTQRIVTRVCYCSVFDECWTRSSVESERPRAVKQCPAPKVQYRE